MTDKTDKPTAAERPSARSVDTVAFHEAATEPPRVAASPADLDLTRPDRPTTVVRERPPQPPARYSSGEEIARGGMGRVIEATDTLLDRVVAVKQALTLDPELLRRFARETKITARLEHPSIVPVYDAGIDGDAPFYVMRRVTGRPLAELITAAPTLAERLALVPNLLAAAQAVAHAHSRGIVHRDIKPSNILVGEHGETVVIDWGLAKVVGEPDDDDPIEISAGDSLRTRAGTVFGTPGFMSPSQLRGEPVGGAADVYALGASLYFVLAGRPPHHAPTGEAMMALAASGPPRALADAVPGVPSELSTIVETALGYGARSYPDAGAFADDLRRFSTGQLVASHRYSRRERLVRFVRRHRGAVAIGLSAVVVIAILATISIQRIVAERDRADAEARDAAAAQRNERERADQLLLLRARMLVDTNPTEALALLKELGADSPRLAEAHAIANSAIMRGVAFGIRGPEATSLIVELDSTGSRLLQVTLHGALHVWDLDNRAQLFHKQLARGTRAIWVGDKILVYGAGDTTWLDLRTGTLEKSSLPPLKYVVTSVDSATIAATTEDDQLVAIVGDSVRPLWPGHPTTDLAVPRDGSWIAGSDGKELVVLARDGTELARRAGRCTVLVPSRSRRLACIDDGKLFELVLGEVTPRWRHVDTSAIHRLVLGFSYRDEELLIAMGSGHLVALGDDRLREITRISGAVRFTSEVGASETLLITSTLEVLYLSRVENRTIRLPHSMGSMRIASSSKHRRVAVVSAEAILVYDLDAISARAIDAPAEVAGEFFDDDTLLMSDDSHARMWWRDVASGRETPIDHAFPRPNKRFEFEADRRSMLVSSFDSETNEVVRLHEHSERIEPVYLGPPLHGFVSLPDGSLLLAVANRVSISTPSATGAPVLRELVRFEHAVDTIGGLAGSRFMAISVRGELVRGAVAGGTVERVAIPPPLAGEVTNHQATSTLSFDQTGNVVAAWGARIWKWTDRLELLATLDGPVLALQVISPQVFASTPAGRATLIDLSTGALHSLPPHGIPAVFDRNATTFALEIGGTYHVFEPSKRTLWPTPIGKVFPPPSLSPDGRRLLARVGHGLALWQLPRGEGALAPRLERHTNATLSRDGVLIWPWQHR